MHNSGNPRMVRVGRDLKAHPVPVDFWVEREPKKVNFTFYFLFFSILSPTDRKLNRDGHDLEDTEL